jgi:hypothetical protein
VACHRLGCNGLKAFPGTLTQDEALHEATYHGWFRDGGNPCCPKHREARRLYERVEEYSEPVFHPRDE